MVARSGGDAGAGADEAELGRATIGGRVDGKVLLMAADQVPDVQVILVPHPVVWERHEHPWAEKM